MNKGHVINKKIISNIIIMILIAANIFVGVLNINVRRPKCISDDCNRVRVAGTHYCSKHSCVMNEREICLKVTSRSSK